MFLLFSESKGTTRAITVSSEYSNATHQGYKLTAKTLRGARFCDKCTGLLIAPDVRCLFSTAHEIAL